MATGPIFRIGDIVYLAESANLGELEAYKIGAVHQRTPGRWVYQIFIEQKPPHEATIGGRIDLKSTLELFYEESELVTLCEAVDAALSNADTRTNKLQLSLNSCGSPDPVTEGDSKFSIDDVIFLRASAKIGFLESYTVTNIHQRPNSPEFLYELDIRGVQERPGGNQLSDTPRQIFFKEREIVDKCAALQLAIEALDRKTLRLLGVKLSLCVEPATSELGS